MKTNSSKIISTLLLVFLSTPAFAQKAGQSSKISTGIVDNVQQVKLQSEAGTGALVGGGLGLLSAGGKSTSKKARNSIIGAAAGAGVASAAQGSRSGMQYTVRTSEGSSIRVVTDQTEIRVGDCVAVEESGSTANIRRLGAVACDPKSAQARQQLQGSFQQEAVECSNAKQTLVDAKTAEQVDLARRKMEILCSS